MSSFLSGSVVRERLGAEQEWGVERLLEVSESDETLRAEQRGR
jgi:hypothetical protein